MPQQNEFVPHLTVRENVALAAWLKGVERRERRTAVDAALEQANLAELADHVDEPTVGLDPAQREGLRAVLAAVDDTDIVVSTHQVDDIDEAFDTVVVLHQGRIIFQGTTEQFLGLAEPGDRRGERAYLALAPDVNA
jgi:ABC-2 type transport system ATP-binding protein